MYYQHLLGYKMFNRKLLSPAVCLKSTTALLDTKLDTTLG